MPANARVLIAFFVGSLLYTGLITTLNTRAIREQNPGNAVSNGRSLVHNSAVYSIDNYWYVNQVKNYLEHGRFTVDIHKDRYEVRRTPVYPVFYGIHYYLFGEANSFRYIRYTQALLLALAVVALYLAVFRFTQRRSAAGIAAILYGLFPLVPACTQYTTTEALSSEFVCFTLYFLSKANQQNDLRNWFLSGLFFALGALCRPTIIFLALPCAVLLWSVNAGAFKRLLQSGFAFAAGALLLFAPWTIRNYRLTGDIILLEKFYGDPMDYGMPNIHLRQWISCWTNPADFTSENVSNRMLINLMNKEPLSGDSLVGQFLAVMPERAFAVNSEPEVCAAFQALYAYYTGISKAVPASEKAALEAKASQAFIGLRDTYIRTSPLDYYVVRNGVFLKSVIFQSNAYSLAFLDDYANSLWKRSVKAVLFLVSVLSWFSLLLLFPWRRPFANIYWLSVLFVAVSVAAIIWFLGYYEARYNMPIFPLLFACLAIWKTEAFRRLRLKLNP